MAPAVQATLQVSPFRRDKDLTCIYTDKRPDFCRELPNWMFDEGYCAGMTLGLPEISIEGFDEFAAVLASLGTNRKRGAQSGVLAMFGCGLRPAIPRRLCKRNQRRDEASRGQQRPASLARAYGLPCISRLEPLDDHPRRMLTRSAGSCRAMPPRYPHDRPLGIMTRTHDTDAARGRASRQCSFPNRRRFKRHD